MILIYLRSMLPKGGVMAELGTYPGLLRMQELPTVDMKK